MDGADAARDAIEKGLTPEDDAGDDDGDLRLAPVVAADGARVALPSRVIASSMAPGGSGSALGARIGARSHDASAISHARAESAVCGHGLEGRMENGRPTEIAAC